ncbi:putative 44 kDa major outer membrane protein [Anaplasma phagocytophilum str. CRT53-1]|uniref:Putative 44 kDa major outer membrane protein n=1 Tax=Anaplasma phagocytophilum str. CRT53-1 TaxID=1359157 RepID=A0A0F3PP06_ANAPH|nr:putative 44 kDa major outer membrane protein [Anaplasma phagocytophilum str. CRT53-1]
MKNKTKGIRDSGSKEDDADTVYLLAKVLAYDVVTGQTDNLAAALAKTSGKDIVQFAKAVGVSHPNIDSKVCRTKKGSSSQGSSYGMYAGMTNAKSSDQKNDTSLCGGHGTKHGSGGSPGQNSPQVLRDFVKATLLVDGSKNWPTSTAAADSDQKATPNDNATAVARDLVQELTPEEKTIVAGLLAKTIEGGEVVEN